MREEFEKLPEIKERIKRSEAFYCQKGDWYLSPHEGCREDEAFLDGALYAYQEQQKKIDEVLNLVCRLQHSSGERIYSEVKDLLK